MNARRIGTARALLAWVAMLAGFVYFLWDVARLNITGLAVFGVLLVVFALWLLGVFTRAFWTAPDRSEDQ
jgi:hypothetical protein